MKNGDFSAAQLALLGGNNKKTSPVARRAL